MDLGRLRWRMRGAWLWPAFVALTFVDAVLLRELPVYRPRPHDLVGALLVAATVNLVAVAIVAPLAARLLRRRRPELPRPVAENHAGTALVLGVTLTFAVVGLMKL